MGMATAIRVARKSRNIRRGHDVAKLGLVTTLLAAAPAVLDVSREASAIGIGALVILPALLHLLVKRRLLVADPIIVLGGVWMLAVTLPVLAPEFYKDRAWNSLSPYSLDIAALWMYRSWAAFCLAYWCAKILIRNKRKPAVGSYDQRVQLVMRRCIGCFGCVGTLIYIIFMGGHTYQILEEAAVADSTPKQIILVFSNLSYAYVFLYFKSRDDSPFEKFDRNLLIAILSVQSIVFIGSGSKYSMMALGAAWLLGNANSIKRPGILKELIISIGGIVCIFAISYLVAAYRGELVSRNLPPTNASVTEVIAFQIDVMTTAVTNTLNGEEIGKGYYTEYDSSFIFDRFAHVLTFARFMEIIRFQSPYENAYASIIAPVFAVLPRAVLPEKVHFFDSGDFAHMAGWEYGGLSISIPGSLFWAWGYLGILAGMAALGLGLSWLWSRSSGSNSIDFILRTVMFGLMITLLDVGETFQTVTVAATRLFILLIVLRWAVRMTLRRTVAAKAVQERTFQHAPPIPRPIFKP